MFCSFTHSSHLISSASHFLSSSLCLLFWFLHNSIHISSPPCSEIRAWRVSVIHVFPLLSDFVNGKLTKASVLSGLLFHCLQSLWYLGDILILHFLMGLLSGAEYVPISIDNDELSLQGKMTRGEFLLFLWYFSSSMRFLGDPLVLRTQCMQQVLY